MKNKTSQLIKSALSTGFYGYWCVYRSTHTRAESGDENECMDNTLTCSPRIFEPLFCL